MDKYLQFVRQSDDVTELFIYGDIRKGSIIEKIFGIEDETRTGALDFAQKLEEVDTPKLTVRINSYGGSVSEGLAIYNLLKRCKQEVTTVCDGFACSAASVIFCAGEKRLQPNTSLLMIHNAWTYGGEGNANDFRKLADDLDKITQPSVEAYKSVSSLSEEEIKELMDAESWITAEDSLKYGFCTEIPDNDANQSLESHYVLNMVNKIQSMSNRETELINEVTELNEKIEELTKQEAPKNAWSRFFK